MRNSDQYPPENLDLRLLEYFLNGLYFSVLHLLRHHGATAPLRGRNSLLTMWSWRRGRNADVVSAGSTHLEEIE